MYIIIFTHICKSQITLTEVQCCRLTVNNIVINIKEKLQIFSDMMCPQFSRFKITSTSVTVRCQSIHLSGRIILQPELVGVFCQTSSPDFFHTCHNFFGSPDFTSLADTVVVRILQIILKFVPRSFHTVHCTAQT